MRSDVHTAALRAAAKVAFSVAFMTGCAASTDLTEAKADNDADDTEPGTTESDISTSRRPTAGRVATGGCHKKPEKPEEPKPTCEQLINAAFPTEGMYPGEKKDVSAEVQACCTDLLVADEGWTAAHRWDCCANATPGADIGLACTPWGPPVPPSMKRRGKKTTPPDAWIARLRGTETRLLEVA